MGQGFVLGLGGSNGLGSLGHQRIINGPRIVGLLGKAHMGWAQFGKLGP